MPEAAETIRELISGFNMMQAGAGLLPTSGQTAFQMPATPMPALKHPGQLSMELQQMGTQQLQQATQQMQSLREMPAPGVLGLRPGGLPPDLGQPPAPVSAAAGAFSSQYQARMQDIESRYLSPHQAQSYAHGAGQAGFSQMPSPVFQTAPTMGIFRPQMTQPPPMQLARESPMIPTPFTPQLPTPRFQTTAEMQYQQRAVDDERMFAATMAAAPMAANVAGNLAAGGVGAGIARMAGGRLGGMFGARGRAIGQMGGTIAGGIGGLFMGAGDLAERGMEAGVVEPIMRRRAMGRQLERMSQDFVVGGPDMNQVTGRGLSARAAVRLAGGIQQDVEEGQTGGFNMRDMMRITNMAAQGGMLDMAQSGEQIRSQVRNVARGLQSFMQIAQEPDVQRAMQQMSSMRTMGLTIPETNVAMRNAQTFARMAGTTVQGIQEQAGMPGAMTFQQMGMTAGLGMQVGHASAAMARQAVAGGAFTPAQLTMAGGQPGLTQSLTEAGAAGLGVDFPLLAMLERGGPGGQLSINRERAQQIMRGELSLSQQAQLGAQNVQNLGGESVITELSTRINELRDELGRTLGPQSTALMTMRQATNLMGEVPGLTFGAALKQLGLGQQQARSLEVMGQSSGFWQNLRDQHEVNIRQLREDERARRDAWQEKSSLSSRFGRWWDEHGVLDRPGEMLRGAGQAISEWWTDRGATQEASERGAAFVGRERDLEVESERQSEALRNFIGTEGFQRYRQAYQGQLSRGTGRIMPTGGQVAGAAWNTALDVGSTVAGVLGTPLLGGAASFLTDPLRSGAGTESTYVSALKARGGLRGAIGGTFASLATLTGGTNPLEAVRAHIEGRESAEMGRMLQSGADLTGKQKATIAQDLRTAYKEYGKAEGVTVSDDKDRIGTMVQAAVKRFEENASWYGDEAVTSGEMKTDMIEALVASGEDREVATKFVNEKFNAGLGALVMNKAKPLLSEKAKGAWAKTEKAVGYEGKLAGADLKAVQANAAEQIEEVKELTGFYEDIDASKKAWNAFKDQVTTGSTEEMLMMTALAQGAWGADESEEGARLRKLLTKKLGPERVDQLRDSAAAKLERVEDKEMFREFGGKLGREATFEDAAAVVKGVATKFKGAKASTAIARGATKWREAGITAFEGMFGEGGGIENVLERLRKDPEQIEQLRKQSPELARALEGVVQAESPEAREAAEQQVLERLFKTGGGGRKTGGEFGGEGVGGAAERKEREAMGLEESIEASIKKGKPGEAFAKSVPAFAKATKELSEATEDLKKTVIASKLAFRLPGFG